MFPIAANRSDEENTTPYVDDVFSTTLYTGNGSTQTITNGIDLAGKGGLVWVKQRQSLGTTNHFLMDTARGSGFCILSNQNFGNTAFSSIGSSFSFDSSGFSLTSNLGSLNALSNTYASWTFRKAAKFFDVVTYTGNGVAGRQIAHSLGVAPGMIIIKATNQAYDWGVHHRSTGVSNIMYLNLTNAQSNNPYFISATDSSTFTVGYSGLNSTYSNESGTTYVAYLFAHDTSSTGIIQCGSFTTDGSGNATVNLGWEPQWILAKPKSSNQVWWILDTMRSFSVTQGYALCPNNANAESTSFSSGQIQPLANGFKTAGWPLVNEDYIYMAIRRPNKPPTTGTQVFSPNAVNVPAGTQITTNFAVDMTMATYRAGQGTRVEDRLRGISTTPSNVTTEYYLTTANTNAEANSVGLTYGWNNTGFLMNNGYANASDVFWNFKRAPGFFDVVCYTGTGGGVALNHNLGVIPEIVFYKARSTTSNWFGTRIINPAGGINSAITGLSFNSSSAGINFNASSFGGGGFTATTIPSTGAYDFTGSNLPFDAGVTYVAYLFATLAGISKVGSYTGNGTSQNIDCGFAAGARFVLVKATSTTGDWLVADTARGIVSGNDPRLSLNSTAAEVTGEDWLYPYAPGFTVNQTTASANASGVSYIFLAIS